VKYQLSAAVRKFVRAEDGATMVEYGLMLTLIAIVCLVAVTSVGTKTKTLFTNASATL
jgi:pilus assembly protein Flp/PilA